MRQGRELKSEVNKVCQGQGTLGIVEITRGMHRGPEGSENGDREVDKRRPRKNSHRERERERRAAFEEDRYQNQERERAEKRLEKRKVLPYLGPAVHPGDYRAVLDEAAAGYAAAL